MIQETKETLSLNIKKPYFDMLVSYFYRRAGNFKHNNFLKANTTRGNPLTQIYIFKIYLVMVSYLYLLYGNRKPRAYFKHVLASLESFNGSWFPCGSWFPIQGNFEIGVLTC